MFTLTEITINKNAGLILTFQDGDQGIQFSGIISKYDIDLINNISTIYINLTNEN